jgi:hypothetical protein
VFLSTKSRDCDWGDPGGFLNTCSWQTRYLYHEDIGRERVLTQLFSSFAFLRLSSVLFNIAEELLKLFPGFFYFAEGFMRLFPASTLEEDFLTSWISASVYTLSVAKAITILIRKLQELSSESRLCSSDHQIFYKQVRMVNFWMYAKGDQRLIIVSRNYLYRSWKCCQVCLLNSTPLPWTRNW